MVEPIFRMKILSAAQIKEADAFTILNEPVLSIDLMERAALKCSLFITKHFPKCELSVFCGVGNNGGDGLAIARQLNQRGHHVVCYGIIFSTKHSDDFTINKNRLIDSGVPYIPIYNTNDIPSITPNSIVIDAIFGSGLNRPAQGLTKSVIELINNCSNHVISIDVPSGLFCEDNTNNDLDAIIKADYTLTFQLPKLAFFLPENAPFVNKFEVLDIGLLPSYFDTVESSNFLLTKKSISGILKQRSKFSHKGTFGHAKLAVGSFGKIGAGLLSSLACLRGGSGLVSVVTPKAGTPVFQTAIPEVMVKQNPGKKHLKPTNSITQIVGLGPGIGQHPETAKFVHDHLKAAKLPMIIDADALNILAQNKEWINLIPESSILTPHPKEFERLVGQWNGDTEKLRLQRELAEQQNIIVVLKGAFTSIALSDGRLFFNTTGNPGMATAGSGDVLTGILSSLISQGYSSEDASLLGVYVHGIAGDLALKKKGYESLIARDIIDHLGEAFISLYPES